MSESLLRKLFKYNTMYSSSNKIEQGLWLSKFLSAAQSTECRHEKEAGPTVVNTPLAFALSRKCVT